MATTEDEQHPIIDDRFEAEVDNEDYEEVFLDSQAMNEGSSILGATTNFTNCIIGAGAIGLGGAIAESGGLISIFTIVSCAVLVKMSLDLVIELSLTHGCSSFEQLGQTALGIPGRLLIVVAKFAYSFGCLIAYTVVIQDNLGPALADVVHGAETNTTLVTWIASATIVLPLCLLRDMTPLESASFISVLSMLSIVAIVIYLWWVGVPDQIAVAETATERHSFYKHWLEIRWIGFLNNMGTFVFSFVCQHTVHLAFHSLRPELRNLQSWKAVSSASLATSCLVSLAVGTFVYMTFWERTVSDIFQVYPATKLLDGAKLLLCFTMLLTFPMPFFTCRELIALSCSCWRSGIEEEEQQDEGDLPAALVENDLEEPLVQRQQDDDPEDGGNDETSPTTYTSLSDLLALQNSRSSLVESDEEDVSLAPLGTTPHTLLTVSLWFVATLLAIAAPNLGDVLDLVGCLSGSLIAFILPSLIAIRLSGYTHTSGLLLVFGGIVGMVGTYCSIRQLIRDSHGEPER